MKETQWAPSLSVSCGFSQAALSAISRSSCSARTGGWGRDALPLLILGRLCIRQPGSDKSSRRLGAPIRGHTSGTEQGWGWEGFFHPAIMAALACVEPWEVGSLEPLTALRLIAHLRSLVFLPILYPVSPTAEIGSCRCLCYLSWVASTLL